MPGIYQLVDALPSVVVGMLAIWVSGSTLHWFLRTSIVGAGLLLLILIPAYELVIAFVTEVLVVVSGMAIWRWRRARKSSKPEQQPSSSWRVQVSLKTILLLTAVIAVVLAVAVRFPSLTWPQWGRWVGIGLAAGLVTLFCAWLVLGTARRRRRVLAATVGIPVIAFGILFFELISYATYQWSYFSFDLLEYFLDSDRQSWMWKQWLHYTGTLLIAVLSLCAWIYLFIRAGWLVPFSRAESEHGTLNSNRTFRFRCIAAAFTLAVAGLPLYLIWRLLTPPPLPNNAVSLPSSYEPFVAAGEMIGSASKTRLMKSYQLTTPQLQNELAKHTDAFDRMRQAFSESDRKGVALDLPDAFWNLVFAVRARLELAGRLQSHELQFEAAIDWLLLSDLMGSPQSVADAGMLSGWKIQAIEQLWDCRSKLSNDQLQQAIDLLTTRDGEEKPWEEYVERQQIEDANKGWEVHLMILFADWTGNDLYAWQRQSYNLDVARLRMFVNELAIILYERESGKPLVQLDDLVPKYLPALPSDPFGVGPLKYRVSGTTRTLYSVGPNGIDDGGAKAIGQDGMDGGDLTSDDLFPQPTSPTPSSAASP